MTKYGSSFWSENSAYYERVRETVKNESKMRVRMSIGTFVIFGYNFVIFSDIETVSYLYFHSQCSNLKKLARLE